MKRKVFLFCGIFLAIAIYANAQEVSIPEAPQEYRRPVNYDPAPYRYKFKLHDLMENYSGSMMLEAEKVYEKVLDVNSKGRWKPIGSSLDRHVTPEWFEDIKFGMFIDWGLWSVGGWAMKKENGAMYPDWYENFIYTSDEFKEYHKRNWGEDFESDDLIPLFQAKEYQPEKLLDLAAEAGMKYVIPFLKHHSGFCLWPSSYTHRHTGVSIGKDLTKPLVDGCRERGLKFGFYFSTDEWEYPVYDKQGDLMIRKWAGKYEPYSTKYENRASGKIAVKDFAKHYIIPQAVEFIDKYDPDILWYDGEWSTPVELMGTYDIAAYFYNRAEGRKEVAVNDRYGIESGKYLRSYRGDYYTSEYDDMTAENKARHAWEECRGISQSFGFNWQDTDENVISSKEFVDMFVNIVSKGGNLLLIVNLDGQGALPDIQESRLRDIGKWLKVNGEGIYYTRPYTVTSENNIRYTRSKDEKTVYAISLDWPGKTLELKSVKPSEKSKIYMLGYKEPLKWSYVNETTIIILPSKLQKATNRPCEHAYTFRIEE